MVQWLGLSALTGEAQVQPLVVEQDFTSCAARQGGGGEGWGGVEVEREMEQKKKNLQF